MPIEQGMPDVDVTFGDEVYVRSDGQPTVAPNIIADDKTWGEMTQGYRCCRCFAVQSEAFPDVCEFPVCNFRIKDDQLRVLEAGHRGEVDMAYVEPEERFDYEQEQWKKSEGGILIPGYIEKHGP